MGFCIHERAVILTECRFAKGGNVFLRDGAIINNRCLIDNRGSVTIGENSSISVGCKIYTMGHDIDSIDFACHIRPVVVGNYVWVCADAMIQPGVRIADGAVVLPGSVVTRDVDAFAVVGGAPARFIRARTSGLRYKIAWSPLVPPFG